MKGDSAPGPRCDKAVKDRPSPTAGRAGSAERRKMLINNAEVILKWSNGKTTRIGTIDITADKNGMMQAKMKHIFQRLGWELVRKGFALMFHGRKWKEEQE